MLTFEIQKKTRKTRPRRPLKSITYRKTCQF